ncbi:MAG: type II toxin-antitoxin system RelB/DinJ family antitoxin [Gammaproteobacteria bacterium]|nr:type II toxin-antitoxin system RelB/DinJ family antitoxin [Gammaproteobacteria bacterium]
MVTHSTMLHVRMDSELKREAIQALAAMGLTASEAVRLLFHRIAVDQAFPLELKVPNADTKRAMAEVDEMVKNRRARFANADEMFADLERAARGSASRPATPG